MRRHAGDPANKTHLQYPVSTMFRHISVLYSWFVSPRSPALWHRSSWPEGRRADGALPPPLLPQDGAWPYPPPYRLP